MCGRKRRLPAEPKRLLSRQHAHVEPLPREQRKGGELLTPRRQQDIPLCSLKKLRGFLSRGKAESRLCISRALPQHAEQPRSLRSAGRLYALRDSCRIGVRRIDHQRACSLLQQCAHLLLRAPSFQHTHTVKTAQQLCAVLCRNGNRRGNSLPLAELRELSSLCGPSKDQYLTHRLTLSSIISAALLLSASTPSSSV